MKTCPHCNGLGQVLTGGEAGADRKRFKLPAGVVANEMGITRQYLSDLERDRREWNYTLAKRFYVALLALLEQKP